MEEPVTKKNILVGFIMIVALLALQVGAVYAAPAAQATSITGDVQSVTQSTDSSGATIFEVTISDGTTTQTVKISAATAEALNLVTLNPDGVTYTINPTAVGMNVTIDSTMVLTDPCQLP